MRPRSIEDNLTLIILGVGNVVCFENSNWLCATLYTNILAYLKSFTLHVPVSRICTALCCEITRYNTERKNALASFRTCSFFLTNSRARKSELSCCQCVK
jgi:hypothetical protein